MSWKEIAGMPCAFVSPLKTRKDERGSLTELMRLDSVPRSAEPFKPARVGWQSNMAYMSWTEEGVVRGPHEHREQWDYFLFPGPGVFELHLWDNSPNDVPDNVPDYRYHRLRVGDGTPTAVIVPPGVIHGYQCIKGRGLVINMPSELFKGWGLKGEIDEIRHEDDPDSPFKIPMTLCVLGFKELLDLITPINEGFSRNPEAEKKVKVVILNEGDVEEVVKVAPGDVSGFKDGIYSGAGFYGGNARALTLADVESELADGEMTEELAAELRKEFS